MNRSRLKNALCAVLLLAAAASIVIGVRRGEIPVVLNKAQNICFECIGLG